MKFQFYGDSWFWTWNWDRNTKPVSAEIRKLYGPKISSIFRQWDCISFIKILLEELGHEVSFKNRPRNTFKQTVHNIISDDSGSDQVDYHVVMYSNPLRGRQMKEYIIKNKDLDYSEFEEKYFRITENELYKLGLYAKQRNTIFLIVGGQATIPRYIFDRVPKDARDNLVLLSECISSEILGITPALGTFKLADFTGKDVNVPWGKVNSSIVDQIWEQINQWTKRVHNAGLCFPDSAHIGPAGTVFFLDYLFKYIEDK